MGSSSSVINPSLKTTQVKLDWYVGPNASQPKVWNEIYSTRPWFSKDLVNITASYHKIDSETVSVTNAGFRNDGTRKESKGTAKTIRCDNTLGYNCQDMSRFDVRFSFFQPSDRNKGNYWILDVVRDQSNDRYDYALVTDPSATMIWFLSSTTDMPDEIVQRFMNQLKNAKVDTRELRKTRR